MRVALVADWLVTYGGAEHTIAEFCSMFPGSPLFTTVARPSSLGPLAKAPIRTTSLQRWYQVLRNHQVLLPWMPASVEGIDLRAFDCILSSSHAVAKGIVPPSTAVHVCYCHTPMRYAWEMESAYLEDFRIPKRFRPRIKRMLKRLRRWDLTTAKRVDHFLCNSAEIRERIQRIYNRDAVVVPPPVDDRFFASAISLSPTPHPSPEGGGESLLQRIDLPFPHRGKGPGDGGYYLALGRLVPYKRFDLLIETANALKLPLVIAGTGQDEQRLRRLAGPTVTLLGFVPDPDLPALYAGATAFLFPAHEDAGIAPREALACGTPVVAYGRGGVLDAVEDGTTGLFFHEQTQASVGDALRRLEMMQWDRAAIRASAKGFSQTAFREKIRTEVDAAYEHYRRRA